MGFVIVLLDLSRNGFDLLPDVFGWTLIVLGVVSARAWLPSYGTLLSLGLVSGVISVVTYWPAVLDRVGESGGWALSLPQIVFSLMLCRDLIPLAREPDQVAAARFRLLSWLFVVVAVAPVLVFGGGIDALLAPTAVVSVLVQVYFVYWLFTISKRPYVLA